MKNLQQLAISEDGIAFDPTTGDTYTLNRTGAIALRKLAGGTPISEIVQELLQTYPTSCESVERDLADFVQQVKLLGFAGGAS